MSRILAVLACCAVLTVAACSSSTSTIGTGPSAVALTSESPTGEPSANSTSSPSPGPTAAPTASPTTEPTAAPTASPSAKPPAKPTASPKPRYTSKPTAPCKTTTAGGSVRVTIADFKFVPVKVKARVGQIITFTNTGYEQHTATLDTENCKTRTLDTGESDGMVFATAGSYKFHCSIHTWMMGTITIRP